MRRKRDLNTKKIVAAAVELVRNEGFHKLSLHKVAKSLDVKTPSLYNHISSYEDLVQELSLYSVQKLKQKWADELIGVDKDQALEVILDTYLAFVKNDPELHQLMNTPPIEMTEKWVKASEDLAEIVVKVVSLHCQSRTECIHKVRFLRSFLSGFASISVANGFKMDIPIEETYQFAKKSLTLMLKSDL